MRYRNHSYVGDTWQISPDSFNLSRRGTRFPCGKRGSGVGNCLVTRVGFLRRPPRLRSREALVESSEWLHRILSPEQTVRSTYRSSYLVAHPILVRSSLHPHNPKPFLLLSSLRHSQPRLSVYSRARVLSVSHVVSAKQIDPFSPTSLVRDFQIVYDTTRHDIVTLRYARASWPVMLTDFSDYENSESNTQRSRWTI